MLINSLKFTPKTAKIIVDRGGNEEKILALSLLMGNYNPLRKFSKNDSPIDLEKLEAYKDRLENLISEMVSDMDVDVSKAVAQKSKNQGTYSKYKEAMAAGKQIDCQDSSPDYGGYSWGMVVSQKEMDKDLPTLPSGLGFVRLDYLKAKASKEKTVKDWAIIEYCENVAKKYKGHLVQMVGKNYVGSPGGNSWNKGTNFSWKVLNGTIGDWEGMKDFEIKQYGKLSDHPYREIIMHLINNNIDFVLSDKKGSTSMYFDWEMLRFLENVGFYDAVLRLNEYGKVRLSNHHGHNSNKDEFAVYMVKEGQITLSAFLAVVEATNKYSRSLFERATGKKIDQTN